MRTDTRLGTFDDVIRNCKPEIATIVQSIRDLVIEIHPDTVEVPRPGEKSLAYGVGPKKMSEAYLYAMPQREYVNLGFYHGTSLPDPDGLLEGTGKSLRHVKIHSIADVHRPAVRQLIEESVQERRRALKLNV